MSFSIIIRSLLLLMKSLQLVIGKLKVDSISFSLSLGIILSLLATIFGVSWYLVRIQQSQKELVLKLLSENQRLTNLITSKDPMTFSTLQTLSNQVTPVAMPFDGMPGDDISVSKAIAERYQKAGFDPAAAYDDPETALQDFDLKQFGL